MVNQLEVDVGIIAILIKSSDPKSYGKGREKFVFFLNNFF